MALPADLTKVNFDEDGDNPLTARSEFASNVDKINQILSTLKDNAGEVEVISTSGSTDRSLADRADDEIWIEDHGGVADGATDSWTAFSNALSAASGKTLRFAGGGTYKMVMPNNSALTPGADTKIVGDGAHLNIVSEGGGKATWHFLYILNDRVTIDGLRLNFDPQDGDSGIAFNVGANEFRVQNCRISGGHTDLIETTFHCFVMHTSNNSGDIWIENNTIRNFRYMWLKSNSNTTSQFRVSIRGNTFLNSYASTIAFNTPNGIVEEAVIQGNFFIHANGGPTFGTNGIHLAVGSANRVDIVGNVFLGEGLEAVHFEEKNTDVLVKGNIITNNGHGVRIWDNNVGGASDTPEHVAIIGNTFRKPSGTGEAISLGNASAADYSRYIIAENLIHGYDVGIDAYNNNPEFVTIHDNYIQACDPAIKLLNASPSVYDNSIVNCTTGISVTNGGMMGHHILEGVGNVATATNGRVSLAGFTMTITTSVPGSTATDFDIIGLGAVIYGHALIDWFHDSSRHRQSVRELTWDGTSLTDTSKVSTGSGGVALTGLVNNAGQLAVRLNNTEATARNGGRLTVKLEGGLRAA